MTQWLDTARGREARDRSAAVPVPDSPPRLGPEDLALLRRWVGSDALKRRRASLMKDAGVSGIERAEALCDRLLRDGWLVRHESLTGGAWQWEAITWRDLDRLQGLLAVSSPRSRQAERGVLLHSASEWVGVRASAGSVLDPDLLDELQRALDQLGNDSALRVDVLGVRLALMRAIAAWHDGGARGSRRDFALQARGSTKGIGDADWRWLETAFDLDRLQIARFEPVAWLAGDIELQWQQQRVQVGALQSVGLLLTDLRRVQAASTPQRWWLIENRASFERQARQREPGHVLVWMPGRPSPAWLDALAQLLALAPAPAWISADADPAGVDIACTVGALWQARGLAWAPHRMGVAEWTATPQYWPLNEHDRRLIGVLLARPELPGDLRALCVAMQREGRKAEQEGWV